MNLQIQGYRENIWFAVCPLDHDVILGMNWNKKHKAKENLEANQEIFEIQKQRRSIIASQRKQLPVISLTTIPAGYRNGLPLFSISLKLTEEKSNK